MRRLAFVCLLMTMFASSKPARAADNAHEVFLNSLGFSIASGDNNIQLSPGFNYGIFSWLSGGVNVTFHSSSYILTKITRFSLLIGPTFNVGGPIENSYFFTLGFALKTGGSTLDGTELTKTDAATGVVTSAQSGKVVNDPNGTGFGIFVGKRFAVSGRISFRPSVGVMSTGSIGFVINAFAASVAF